MNGINRTVAVAVGGLMLAGCQTMTGNTARLNSGIRVAEQASGREHAENLLATGRTALTERNYAAAIVALREAALEPDLAAEAHNALGVAYGGIGRHDLAGRYFRQASNEDPTVEKYRDNFVRSLVADRRARLALLERPALPAAPPAPSPPVNAPREVAVAVLREGALRPAALSEAPQVRMVRRSPGEVKLTLAASQLASRDPSPGRPLPVVLHRVVAPASMPDPKLPDEPKDLETKAALPSGPAQTGSRTITLAMATGSTDFQSRPVITASGRLTANPSPVDVGQRKAASFAEVFAPMLRTEVHALGLRSSAPPVATELDGLQPADEKLAAAF